jgi:hypothetical protein
MAIRQTYQGVVKEGRVQLPTTTSLPEGSEVYVLVADDWQERPLLDPHLARRKANGWLVSNVGSVLAQQPELLQADGRLVWRFKAFLATKGYPLRGPIGLVDVDAYTGEPLTSEDVAAQIITNATAIARSLSSTNS